MVLDIGPAVVSRKFNPRSNNVLQCHVSSHPTPVFSWFTGNGSTLPDENENKLFLLAGSREEGENEILTCVANLTEGELRTTFCILTGVFTSLSRYNHLHMRRL